MISLDDMRQMKCLSLLSDEHLELLRNACETVVFEKGAYVQKENDIAREIFIVLEGRVAIEIVLPHDRKVGIFIVEPGDLFGWSTVVPPHIITASSLCLENTTMLQISRDRLYELFDKNATLKAAFFEMIAQVIRGRLVDTRTQLTYLLGWEINV
ncbi:MAG: Crp/Fnr family transcriptional regulator [bacterium]|jgi:CRP-like cAMP-binding protein